MKEFITTACLSGTYEDKTIDAYSNPYIITTGKKYQGITKFCCKKIFIRELNYIKECSVYKIYESVFNLKGNNVVDAGYEIRVEYVDLNNKIKTLSRKGNVLFLGFSNRFNIRKLKTYFSEHWCEYLCQNTISVEFKVKLCD